MYGFARIIYIVGIICFVKSYITHAMESKIQIIFQIVFCVNSFGVKSKMKLWAFSSYRCSYACFSLHGIFIIL
jgi:hypothetical protein